MFRLYTGCWGELKALDGYQKNVRNCITLGQKKAGLEVKPALDPKYLS